MGTEMGLIFILMGVLGGQGGELLDYVQTQRYWEARDERIVDITTMSAVLADAEDRPASDKLMAIRSLGELGKAQGADKQAVLKLLTPLVGSNEPFVGQFAKRSIAWVKGDDPPAYARPTAAQLTRDLAVLPASSMMVGQMKMQNKPGGVDLESLMPDFGQPAEQKQQMLDEVHKTLIELATQIGNARIDAVSMGLHFTGNGDDAYAAVVVRGRYDRIGVQLAIEDMAKKEGEELRQYSIGEVEVIAPADEDEVAMLMPSDEVFIFLFGETSPDNPLPIEAVARAWGQPDAKPAFDEKVNAQIEQIDRDKADIWLALQPKGPLLTEMGEVFGPYEAAHATATRDAEGGYDVAWQATGKTEEKVTGSIAFMRSMLDENIAEMKAQLQDVPPQFKQMMEPMLKVMESIKFQQDGKTMTGGMKLDSETLLAPFLGFGMMF